MNLSKDEDRENQDNYPTPTCAIESLLDVEEFNGHILEPACGEGKVSEYLRHRKYQVCSSDLRSDNIAGMTGMDFFTEYSAANPFDNIITNPPYKIAKEFIKHCHDVALDKIALLLRLAFVESENRYEELWSKPEYKPDRIYTFVKRLPYYKDGMWHETGGQFTHAWYVWDLKNKQEKTTLDWLVPNRKLI